MKSKFSFGLSVLESCRKSRRFATMTAMFFCIWSPSRMSSMPFFAERVEKLLRHEPVRRFAERRDVGNMLPYVTGHPVELHAEIADLVAIAQLDLDVPVAVGHRHDAPPQLADRRQQHERDDHDKDDQACRYH
ncbi:hypothetical protein OMP40_29135 [Cohnella rhizosphaerae]|uniref:Uncharacterized protein n=1 Tax=Cohnella rhizosphaerae TaxID=1457232 RepID=A0A9X4KXZ8_9BACL|nr:hypothetical protein [Cohnella rhizosphaerae]MDG0812930.1 hypothetical protein [Cohnella rhizosphaerae]